MKITPPDSRGFFLLAAFFIALPTLNSFYKGQTGRFLISSPMISTGPFQQSVVYVVDHGFFTGARGYVVNKPLKDSSGGYYGGPVDQAGHRYTMHYAGQAREYHGLAAWMPLQLEYEIIKGGWSVLPGDQAVIFGDQINTMWRDLDTRARKGPPATDAPHY